MVYKVKWETIDIDGRKIPDLDPSYFGTMAESKRYVMDIINSDSLSGSIAMEQKHIFKIYNGTRLVYTKTIEPQIRPKMTKRRI